MTTYRHDLGNDRWIAEIIFPDVRGGFFVEAGATNGVNGSGTLFLEQSRDWTGICVEVIPDQFRAIKKFRKCKTDNRALWSMSGKHLSFTLFPERSGHSGLTEVNKNFAKFAGQDVTQQQFEVETVTLLDLLREHEAPNVIDYLCLDVEGAEPAILGAFDFSGPYLIRALSIEGHACDGIMLAAGYIPAVNPFTDVTFESYWLHSSLAAPRLMTTVSKRA